MAILDVIKKGCLYINTATGYIKLLPKTLASLVEMNDGNTVENAITTLNSGVNNVADNLNYVSRFTQPSAVQFGVTDLLNITFGDYSNSAMWDCVISTSDASTLTNSPVTSGAFYAYRKVYVIPKATSGKYKIIVQLTEAYPTSGRRWECVYDTEENAWNGWKSVAPSDRGTATTNINNITEPGVYWINSNYVEGSPVNYGFLDVSRGSGNILQKFYVFSTGKLLTRMYLNSQWYSWTAHAIESNILDSLSSVVANTTSNKMAGALAVKELNSKFSYASAKSVIVGKYSSSWTLSTSGSNIGSSISTVNNDYYTSTSGTSCTITVKQAGLYFVHMYIQGQAGSGASAGIAGVVRSNVSVLGSTDVLYNIQYSYDGIACNANPSRVVYLSANTVLTPLLSKTGGSGTATTTGSSYLEVVKLN